MHDDEMDWALLARYFAGDFSPADAAEVERWLRAAPGRREDLAALRRVWEDASSLPRPERIDAMWQRLARDMRESEESEPAESREVPVLELVPQRPARRIRRWRIPVAAAASLLLAATATVIWREQRASEAERMAEIQVVQEYATTHGQRKLITLPDGSRVQLGVMSSLRLGILRSGRHELELEGEAIFDVVHDPSRPFIVRANHVVTEDLGTRFAVRAYPDEQVRVAVASGNVAVWVDEEGGNDTGPPTAIEGVILNPGHVGTVGADGEVRVAADEDVAPYFAWNDGRLVFRNVSLRDVAAELERWYDVDIAIPDAAVAEQRVTINMPAGSLDRVLDAATVPLRLRHVRSGRSIVIQP